MNNKGFTLIELLIVIAIIGILAGVVVVSLSGSTDKASDASTISSITSIRTAVVSEETNNAGAELCKNVYDNLSGSSLLNDAWTASADCVADTLDNTSDGTGICCIDSASAWTIWGTLSTYDGSTTSDTEKDFYCIDSNGFGGELADDTTAGVIAGTCE